MKKLMILAFFTASAAINGSAQTRPSSAAATLLPDARPLPAGRGTSNVAAIVAPASFTDASSCAYYTYFDVDGGYVTGNNSYGDQEKMMRYSLSDYGMALPAHLDTAYVWFTKKRVGHDASLVVKIYAANSAGEPGALLGTSLPRPVSDMPITGQHTPFKFAAPVTLTTDKYFVSVDVSALNASQDTVCITSKISGCADTNPNSAWERTKTNATKTMFASWNLTIDMGIYGYVSASTLGVDRVAGNSFSAVAYPVPATGMVMVSFVGRDNGNTTLRLKDLSGRTVAMATVRTAGGSTCKVPFDVSGLAGGIYLAELTAGNSREVIKVSIR